MKAEIKPAQDYRAVLIAGGMSKECADRLVAYLDEEKPVENDIERILVDDLRVQMAETLSLSWIIRELRRISTGEDKQASVSALQVLFELNRYLHYPTPEFYRPE
ncbi:TPA: hypothetical protein H2R31_002314 [Salmonella enterica]|nr:hypothetical protein [Salmonella enterica]HEC6737330.1 hypothetical protein [Salmonella enterica subsp. enterica serovar Thompson]